MLRGLLRTGRVYFACGLRFMLYGLASGASTGVGVAPEGFVGGRRFVKLELHVALMGKYYSWADLFFLSPASIFVCDVQPLILGLIISVFFSVYLFFFRIFLPYDQ